MSRSYNQPNDVPSSIGEDQFNTFLYQRKALYEARKEQYFMPLADVTSMPKHYGKSIKRYHYIPLLDDENINDQGIDANGVAIQNGNLYGSSKDIGTIPDKHPTLTEHGGRVNRVGFRRKEIEGSIDKFGFFDEYTQESMDFDTDEQLMTHINREMINGAVQMTEAALQIDILAAAGVVKYAGDAQSIDELSVADRFTYGDFIQLGIELDNNRTPKQTTVITGTRNVDTRVISGGRIMYIGSELIPQLLQLTDYHGSPAFVESKHYAAGTTLLNGEIGSLGHFRIVVVPEMLKHAGAGEVTNDPDALVTEVPNPDYDPDLPESPDNQPTLNRVDVFPLLVVGQESFTTIGFQTDGQAVKFKIYHKAPGEAVAGFHDPYGETGFMSIKWYYGFMALRPERIAVMWTAAK